MPRKNKAPPAQPSALHVIITVSGGVADVLYKPRGVAVSIFDYDVEGGDPNDPRLTRDPDGQACCVHQLPAGGEVVGNKHWPIVRKAIGPAVRSYTRRWRCPGCGRTADCSYEDLAEVGSPFCGDCDCEMTLL